MQARQRRNLVAVTLVASLAMGLGALWARSSNAGVAQTPVDVEPAVTEEAASAGETAELVELLPVTEPLADLARSGRVEADDSTAADDAAANAEEEEDGKAESEDRPAGSPAGAEDETKHELIVTPNFDLSLVPDLNLGVPVSVSGSTHAYYGRSRKVPSLSGSVSEFIGNLPTLKLGSVASTRNLAATIRADHPDAMPKTVEIRPHRWGFDGSTYFSRTRIRLDPIHTRLQLDELGSASVLAPPFLTSDFDGSVRLILIDRHGNVETMDQYGRAGNGARQEPTLRFRPSSSEILIVGVPAQESSSGDVIDIASRLTSSSSAEDAGEGGVLYLRAGMRDVRPPRLDFEIVDPFREPVQGATIMASVDADLIARSTRSGGPVVVDGFVFVKEALSDPLQAGQRLHRDQVGLMDMGFMRVGGAGKSSADGKASLVGLPFRAYEFRVRSPFGDIEPLLFA
ncbi:MAG: hypothetical protein AAGG01_19835, partial [Planctomycetota bacterium]